ncbi:MAG: AsmA-like C-terminal region-containing protein [Candidatus Brocadia sp.]|nr:AsmA-like C-terminal region-containing protein [Candidatus Brocadia sp.]
MQIQKNKNRRLKRILIPCGIFFGMVLAFILIAPVFISGNFIQQKVNQLIEDRFKHNNQVGSVSFHWPNRINISYLTIQREEQNKDSFIHFENIQGTLKLFPLLFRKITVKKLSIQLINYENRLLVKDLVTDRLSFNNGIISTHTRLNVNEGPTTIKGLIDLHQKKPVFDLAFDAKDVHVTQDVPFLDLLPVFKVKDGEIGGMLSVAGSLRGKGAGKEIFNKKLDADVKLEVRDGYVRGNKLFSSILEIMGKKDLYSFDSMEAVIQIKEGKIYAQKIEIQSPLMNLNATGKSEFEGSISYDVIVKINKEHLGKDAEKIAGLVLKQNELPIEIRGTIKDPRVAVKLDKDSLEHVVKGLVNDFLHTSKEKRKKEKKDN